MCCWGRVKFCHYNQLHRFSSISIYTMIFSNKTQCEVMSPKPYYYTPKTIIFLKTSDSLQGIWSSNSGPNWCFREVWRLPSPVQVQGRRASRMLSIWESRESNFLLFFYVEVQIWWLQNDQFFCTICSVSIGKHKRPWTEKQRVHEGREFTLVEQFHLFVLECVLTSPGSVYHSWCLRT